MATIQSSSTGPAAQVNVKRVHITLVGADVGADQVSGAVAATSPAPTDIFVINGRPFHFLAASGGLLAHEEAHRFKETILQLKVEVESVVWWSDSEFHIADLHLADHTNPELQAAETKPAGDPPARTPFPPPASVEVKDAAGNRLYWEARSREPEANARGHQYKMSFTIGGADVDPDMFCGGG